jgi:hypothetical protein
MAPRAGVGTLVVAVLTLAAAMAMFLVVTLLWSKSPAGPSARELGLHPDLGFLDGFSEPGSSPWPAGLQLQLQLPPAPPTIPLVVHQTGPYPSLAEVPPALQKALDTWVQRGPRGVRTQWFGDAAADAYVQTHFPEYGDDYRALRPGAFKADLWRMLILLREGGIYVDCGVHVVAGPEAAGRMWGQLVGADCLFVDDHNVLPGSVWQGVIAARPGHPLIRAIVDTIVGNIRARMYGSNYLDITGPRAVGRAISARLGPALNARMRVTGRLAKPVWRPGVYATSDPDLGTLVVLKYRSRRVWGTAGEHLLDTKVPAYYRTVYGKRQTPHYRELWRRRQVYIDDDDTRP